MSITNVAKVIEWNAEKGFGFAIANGKKYFVHKKALGPISRNPVKGDLITVMQFLETPKGHRITSGVLEGVTLRKVFRDRSSTHVSGGCRNRKLNMALGLALVAIPLTLLTQCKGLPEKIAEQLSVAFPAESMPGSFHKPFYGDRPTYNSSSYRCDGRTHCSDMTSYEEAVFFIRNCPGTEMDGDGDGIPCEKQFGK